MFFASFLIALLQTTTAEFYSSIHAVVTKVLLLGYVPYFANHSASKAANLT